MENVSTYFLGALIIDHQALGRINPYRRRLLGATEEAGEAHITVCRIGDISNRIHVEKIITESKKEVPLYFRTAHLTLYAKYKKGYAEISLLPSL